MLTVQLPCGVSSHVLEGLGKFSDLDSHQFAVASL